MNDVPVGMLQPEVMGWREVSRNVRTVGDVRRVANDQELLIDVAFRGEYGVTVSCAIETES